MSLVLVEAGAGPGCQRKKTDQERAAGQGTNTWSGTSPEGCREELDWSSTGHGSSTKYLSGVGFGVIAAQRMRSRYGKRSSPIFLSPAAPGALCSLGRLGGC